MNSSSTSQVPAGGAATINGVMYQLLWSLLRASKATLIRDPAIDNGLPSEVVIVLEPTGGGGDLIVQHHPRTTVEQIKARPSGGTWSLREIIESVIPDLYLASTTDPKNTDFRFVTEGRIGKWKSVITFFHSLRNRDCPDAPLSDLDDSSELKFAKRRKKDNSSSNIESSDNFWSSDSYTQRSLFIKIAEQVRRRKVVRDAESELRTMLRLRSVLGNFEFVGGQDMERVKQQIDSHLLAIVDRNDDVAQIRDMLTMELARQATSGGAEISCETFFASQGLGATPLSDIGAIRQAVQATSARSLARLGYNQAEDVRWEKSKSCLETWKTAPVLLIAGESGCGKSWLAYGLCQHEQASERLSVVVQSAGTVDVTLERAASEVWQTAAGHDGTIPLMQIGRRLRAVVPGVAFPWLTLIVDGVLDIDQARDLIRQDWQEWGIRLVIATTSDVGKHLERETRGRCQLELVEDFDDSELHRYLYLVLGDSWPDMPDFVRYSLKKPLLASVYRRIVEVAPTANWSPETEYQIFHEFWKQIVEPIDQTCIFALASDHLNQGAESWSVDRLGGIQSVRRLEASGWIRRIDSSVLPKYEFSHIRLLNWACALSLLDRYTNESGSQPQIEKMLHNFLWGRAQRLGFATMDFIWLACASDIVRDRVPDIVDFLAGSSYSHKEVLFKELLPTIGSPVLEALVNRLHHHSPDAVMRHLMAQSIANVGGEEAARIGAELVKSEEPVLRICATSILSQCSIPAALDDLWELHNESQKTPGEFLTESERQNKHLLYRKTFSALKECSREAGQWIGRQIESCDPESELVSDLAYLLAHQSFEVGQPMWLQHKRTLFEKVPKEKQRCLARCVDTFADRDETDWLVESVGVKDDLLDATALRALVRLEPTLAVEQLDRIEIDNFQFASGWFADHLFSATLGETQGKLREMMRDAERVWAVASIYNKRFHFVDAETLALLLDRLRQDLDGVLATPDHRINDGLIEPLRLLVQANTINQLEQLATYAGSPLEDLLVEYVLRIGPRSGVGRDSFTRSEAIGLLLRIKGNGFAVAVNCQLSGKTRYGRSDGIQQAPKRPNSHTVSLLKNISSNEASENGGHWEQCGAAECLADLEEWRPVLALVQRVGLQTSRDITNLPRYGQRPKPVLVQTIIDELSSDSRAASPGDLMALGFGDHECAQFVKSYIQEHDPKGDHAHACVIALELLQDSNSDNVPFLQSQLAVDNHNFSATNALISNGSQAAMVALSEFAGDNVDGMIAVNLIQGLENRLDALARTRATMQRQLAHHGWGVANDIHRVVSRIDETDAGTILSEPAIQDFVRSEAFADEGNSWNTGSKASAIRCLDVVDRNAAFVAAKSVLGRQDAHDRDFYPSLLVEINPARAAEFLVDILLKETDDDVQLAIGLAFAKLDTDNVVDELLQSPEAARRRLGCFITKWRSWSSGLELSLKHALKDPDESVSRMAAEALIALAKERETRLLGETLMQSDDPAERWLILDCMLDLSHPGNQHHLWPLHGPEIGDVLTMTQSNYAAKRLKDLRK